jgi:hypothetical protein
MNEHLINEIKGNYPFALVDVLGYKNRTKASSLDELLKFNNNFITMSDTLKYFSIKIEPPRFLYIADTLFVYPKNEHTSQLKVASVIRYLANLLHHTISIPNNREFVPLRGAISFGEIFVNTNYEINRSLAVPLVLGKAAINCYEWETCQNWIGISIDPNSVEGLKTFDSQSFHELIQDKYLIKWKVPMKNCKNKTIETYAINFIDLRDSRMRRSLNVICQQEQKEEKEEVKEKYKNTREFVKYIYKERKYTDVFEINSRK